jgi:hypothetical protein
MHRILTRFFCIIASVFFSACTQTKTTSVDGFAEARLEFALPKTFSSSAGLRSPPATVGDFDCLVVNVMAADIAPSFGVNIDTPFSKILAGSHCAYPGIISQPIALAAGSNQIRLRIPVGVQRVIQLAGVVSSTNECSAPLIKVTADPDDSDLHPNYSAVYEIGRAVVNLSGDTAVTVNNQYDSGNPKEIQCEGNKEIDCLQPQYISGSPFAKGDGTLTNPYRICTPIQFGNIRNFLVSKFFTLDSDISLSDASWTPIGNTNTPFTGSLDGKLHTVSNFGRSLSLTTGAGLFGEISGTVEKLTVEAYTLAMSSSSLVGALAGKNTGTISRVIVGSGTVNGINSVGGLVGYNTGTIVQSSSAAIVNGMNSVGGLAGFNIGTILQSSSTATVTGLGQEVGGFIGSMGAGFVSQCSATGAASSGGAYAGGFVGVATGTGTLISRSSAIGAVSADNTGGGFVGALTTDARIQDCYSTGAVIVSDYVAGGFVGSLSSGARISEAYALPSTVTALSNYGPFGGANPSGTFGNIYSLDSLPLIGTGFAGVSLSSSQFSTGTGFVGFDFLTVWKNTDNLGSPVQPFLR